MALDMLVHEVQDQFAPPPADGFQGLEWVASPSCRIHEDEAERMSRKAVDQGSVVFEATRQRVDLDMRKFRANALHEVRQVLRRGRILLITAEN